MALSFGGARWGAASDARPELTKPLTSEWKVFPVFGKQLRGEVVPLSKGQQFTFKNLTHKVYAIAVFHDLNRNGVLDKNPFGIPTEPYGFSNNARNTFSAPSFGQASFALSKDRTISITVK